MSTVTLQNENRIIRGTSLSPGLVQGTAFVFEDIFEREQKVYDIEKAKVEEECARFKQAIENVHLELDLSAERIERDLDPAMAEIFRAHQLILRDATFIQEIHTEVEQKLVNIEYALQQVFGHWAEKFQAMENELFQQRADDITDLGRRLLRALAGVQTHSLEKMPVGSILVARNLLPSDTAFFTCRNVVGVIVESGGRGSHFALLTRQLGIPGITGVPDVLKRISTHDVLLLDGLRGKVTVAPNQLSLTQFKDQTNRYQADVATAMQHSHEPAVTRDGVTIPVMANIGNLHDARVAAENGADGVGLFRIEVFFLSRRMLPTQKELVQAISETIAPLQGKPIAVRLLDIGGDKQLPYLHLPTEPDPYLGRRGVRLLREYPELLHVQLQALLQLAQDHDIRIIVPMVTVVEDMEQVRDALITTAADLGHTTLPPLGAMIETPAAALCAEKIAAVSDFLSIGSNDLTQYTMAAGRDNARVQPYFLDDHPAVIKLISHVGKEAQQSTLALCGELAGREDMLPTLLNAGVRLLSVSPPLVPTVKEAIRKSS